MCTLSMNHSTMHDSGHNTVIKVVHFQSDALEETDRGSKHMRPVESETALCYY